MLEKDGCVGLELKGSLLWTLSLQNQPQGVGKALGERCTVKEKAQDQWTWEGDSEKEEKEREGGSEKSMKEHFQRLEWPLVGQMHRSQGGEGISWVWSLGTFATAT